MGVLCNFPSFSLLDPFSAHDLGMQYASVKLCFQLFPVLYQTFLGYVIIMQWRPHDLHFHFVEYAFTSFNRIPWLRTPQCSMNEHMYSILFFATVLPQLCYHLPPQLKAACCTFYYIYILENSFCIVGTCTTKIWYNM